MARSKAPKKRDELVKRVLQDFAERKRDHEEFCRRVERNYKSYRAIIDRKSKADSWNNKLAPPYVAQVVDTVVANLVDDGFQVQVLPRPRVADPVEIERLAAGARAHELLLNYQIDRDRFNKKQNLFILQNAIAGVSVAKPRWVTETGTATVLRTIEIPVADETGAVDEVRRLFEPMVSENAVVCDDPTVEIVRVEDFLWEEAATDIQAARWCVHRVATSMDELRMMQRLGIYENVDQLDDSAIEQGYDDEFNVYDRDLNKDKRMKNRVELLEYWCKEGGEVRCVTIANRKVVLRDERNIYWHGKYPFVVCTTRPDLFSINGRSIVEAIAPLQEQLWSLSNQRLDNLELINNAIFAFRDDVLDPDAFEFYPGAKWSVPGDVSAAVQMFAPNPVVSQISLEAEAMVKGDLQNVTGGLPFLSGSNSQGVDQTTATGVSIITSLAQRMVAHQKLMVNWAYEEIFQQVMALNQQFVREDRVVPMIGKDGFVAFEGIAPETLSGDFQVRVKVGTESLQRQERRAEAQALLQVTAQVAPIMAAVGTPINLKAVYEDFLRAFGKDATEKYFTAMPQPPAGPPGLPGAGGGASAPGEEQGPGGVTAPQATSPETSPSNQTSMSPEVFLQRALASQGGAVNGVA